MNSVVEEVAELKTRVSTLSQNQSRDGSTATAAATAELGAQLLQQAFINFTTHIYQLQDATRHEQHGKRFPVIRCQTKSNHAVRY